MTVTYDGKRLGGNNIQVVVGAPDERRQGLDEDVVLWLASGWWVTLRNEFARAPDVSSRILESAAETLSAMTADSRGAAASILGSAIIEATGPASAIRSERVRAVRWRSDGSRAYWRLSESARLGTTKDARKIGKGLFPPHRKATMSPSAASKVRVRLEFRPSRTCRV